MTPKPTYILGLSAYYHDSAACLVRNGEIVAAAQEERFTRKKHDHNFPRNAVNYCLKQAGITADELTHVAFYDKPWIKFERLLETYLAFAPQGLISFSKAIPLWLKDKLWMGKEIAREVGFDGKLFFPEHHQTHAASAFFPSPYESAAIITADGVGEWTTTSWGVGRGNKIDLQAEIRFPHSLGLLYSAFTYYTGFKVNSGEYKVMGLAPYGEPKYKQLILDELIDLKDDGSFRLNMKYFNYCQGLTMTNSAFDKLFGAPPRKPEAKLTQREMDLARSVQEVTEEAMLRLAKHVRKETGESKLVMAGGVALNCVANGKIHSERIFDEIWVQPAAGDAGGALGAATFAWYQALDNPRKVIKPDAQKGSLLGPGYTDEEIIRELEPTGAKYRLLSSSEQLEETAKHLAAGKIVGWFAGRMEFGPRALGARSIIGDPRRKDMQSAMNLKIKFRESFRPFAPAVLKEDCTEYFDFDGDSPYMLMVAPVQSKRHTKMSAEEEKLFGIEKLNVARSDIPSVTHVDYSARIQTVDEERNPRFYGLLKKFKELTGCGVLINTSFNVRGEPIVNTPGDAYRCFMRTHIDVLILENLILIKEDQPVLEGDTDWRSEFELD